MGIYFQVYNSAPAGRISYRISNKSTGREALDFTEDFRDISSVEKLLPLRDFAPGDYQLRIGIDDGAHSIERLADFSVIARR